jgi:hypothetical protein
MRRVALSAGLGLALAAGGCFTGSSYLVGLEAVSVLAAEPGRICLTLQESSEFRVERLLPEAAGALLDPSSLVWTYSAPGGGASNVARIEGNRILGMNVGDVNITGRYRNKQVDLLVSVVEPMEDFGNISQWYRLGNTVDLYAGDGEFDTVDGYKYSCSFGYPKSIARDSLGNTFVAEELSLRKIDPSGNVSTVAISDLPYLAAGKIRAWESALYILTDVWENEDGGLSYALGRLADGKFEPILTLDGEYTRIDDFDVADGKLYFTFYAYEDGAYLKSLDLGKLTQEEIDSNSVSPEIVAKLGSGADGAFSLCVDPASSMAYFANSMEPVIKSCGLSTGEIRYLAGEEGKQNFIDGNIPNFFRPLRLRMDPSGGAIYVLDFNVLRKVSLTEDGALLTAETVAGEPNPDLQGEAAPGPAEEALFGYSQHRDFVFAGEGKILMIDPREFVVWEINEAQRELPFG